jgi:DNA polymerase-3 subunit alpha
MEFKKPNRFVGLHSHSTYSTFDAIGRPQDHIDFAVKNNMDSLALTDHGNMNGMSHQYMHAKKLSEDGVKFKPIYGVESYFIPSIEDWHRLYAEAKVKGELAPKKKKSKKQEEEQEIASIGNELAQTENELNEITGKPATSEDEDGGTIVENEEESKSNKYKDPIKQRSHLVLLAKNDTGLKSLFKIVSESAADGFYKFPRVDFDSLRRNANGNIVATTACIAGYPAKIVMDNQITGDWKSWGPNKDNFEKIQEELCKTIRQFQEVLGEENYYLEMQFNKLGIQHLLNMHLIEASKRTGVKLVVTCDAHYANPSHWREREIYKMMGWMQRKGGVNADDLPKNVDELKCELYPKNAEQVWDTYKQTGKEFDFYNDQIVADAIERTHDIAHLQIGNVEPDRKVKLPALNRIVEKNELDKLYEDHGKELTEDELAFKELKKLAIQGLKMRKKADNNEYIERLRYELEVIKTLKFSKYFLTYHKIMEVLGQQMLIGNARGSAGGSLLAYVLNITQMDPIRFGLLFERFLTRKKKAFPDIDSDFGDREKAVDLLQDFFGAENVIPVSNFSALKPLSLVKDLSKIFAVPFDQVNKFTVNMSKEVMAVKKQEPGFDAAQFELTFEDLEEYSKSFQEFMATVAYEIPGFRDALDILFKQQRTVSRHAGGVIITDNTRENMPLVKAKNGLQTPWPEGLSARHLEDFGLLKFDILGLGTLRMFEDCIRKILKKEGKKYVTFQDIRKFFMDKLHPDNNAMDDEKVYEHIYWTKHYAGIFQFVKDNVQNFMAEMKANSILDIAAATSIFRPGPMGLDVDMPDGKKVHGAQNVYLINRKNPENIEYIHPIMKDVLDETCGLMIFQEQLQLIVNKLAGTPLEDTDNIRKAFTKKDKANADKQAKEIIALGEKFVKGCMTHSGITKEQAERVWKDFDKWTAYGFNKSHAVAYAITSYQCAWFLTYYPDEWVTTYIDYSVSKGKVSGGEDPKTVALSEVKSLGYVIGKPDINYSEPEYAIATIKGQKTLVPSFNSLTHVGKASFNEISQNRPYSSVEDLLWDINGAWRHSKFNKKAFSTLIKLGAFESMNIVGDDKIFKNYHQMHAVLVDHYDDLKRATARKRDRNYKELLAQYIMENKDLEDWTPGQKIEHSKELAGSVDLNLILPPEVRKLLDDKRIKSIDDWDGENYYWAIVTKVEVKPTKNGRKFLKIRMYGESGAEQNCFVWNYTSKDPSNPSPNIPEYTILVGKFKKTDFGLSTNMNQLKKVI